MGGLIWAIPWIFESRRGFPVSCVREHNQRVGAAGICCSLGVLVVSFEENEEIEKNYDIVHPCPVCAFK